MKVTFELPLPPRELSPNSRAYWAKKARMARDYRNQCGWLAWTAKPAHGRLRAPVEARLIFFWADRRKRDQDNAIASMKAAFDGIVDSGLIPGDDVEQFRIASTIFANDDAHRPRVEITLEEVGK